MSFTTVDKVINFAQLNLNYVYKENLGSGDGTKVVFATKYAPIYDDSLVTTYIGNNSTTSASISEYQGTITFSAAVANGSTAYATYTYSDLTSTQINTLITYADTVIAAETNDTTNASKMELLSNLLTSHLIFKNLAGGDARSGTLNYSIGFFNVSKGSNAQLDIAKMYWENYKTLLDKITVNTAGFAGMTHKQTDNKESVRYFTDFDLSENPSRD